MVDVSSLDWQGLRALFKEAENALHEAETIHTDLSIPSVNQLRYTAYHVLGLMCSTTQDNINEDYQKARRHCQRAIYDAYDSTTAYLLKNIKQFQDDYQKIAITPHFPGYQELIKKAREAQSLLKKDRSDNDNRDGYYVQCRDIARELLKYYEQMEDAREELNKAIQAHNRGVLLGWGGIAVAALALVATIVGVVGTYLGLK